MARHEAARAYDPPWCDVSVVVPVLNEQEGCSRSCTGASAPRSRTSTTSRVRRRRLYGRLGRADRGAAARRDGHRARAALAQLRDGGRDVRRASTTRRGDYVALDARRPPGPAGADPGDAADRPATGADVVYARRIGRDESWLKRLLATAFYSLMERLARVPYQGQAGDFRLMSRRVVDTLRGMPERRRFLRGMVAWVGFEQVPVEYRRAGRAARARRLLPLAVPARGRGAGGVLRRAAGARRLSRDGRRPRSRASPAAVILVLATSSAG